MPKPYDSSMKTLAARYPRAFLSLLEIPAEFVAPMDTDVSVISAATDSVFRLRDQHGDFVLHLEYQVGHDRRLLERVGEYRSRYHRIADGLYVETVIVFLTPHAWRSAYAEGAHYAVHGPNRRLMLEFRPLRLWTMPPEPLMRELGTLPLVALAGFEPAEHDRVIRSIEQRLDPVDSAERLDLLAITQVLAGVYPSAHPRVQFGRDLIRRFPRMKESVFYQEAMQEGEEKGLHRAILKFAQHRFGPPDSATRDALLAVHDVDRLDRMVDRVATAESWADLLNTP